MLQQFYFRIFLIVRVLNALIMQCNLQRKKRKETTLIYVELLRNIALV